MTRGLSDRDDAFFMVVASPGISRREAPLAPRPDSPDMNTQNIPACMHRPAAFARTRRFVSVVTAALALGAATSASATLIDFNSGAADYTGNFTEFGEAAGANFTYSTNAGVGGGGGVAVSGNFDSLHYNAPLTGFGEGTTSIELSVFYKARSALDGTSNASISLGLTSGTDVRLAGTVGSWLSLHIQAQTNTGGQTNFQASFRSRDNSPAVVSGTSGNFQVTHNNWYKFTTVFTYDSATATFSATALIQDYGANGLSDTPSTVLSFTGTPRANVSMADAEQLFASVRTGAPNATGANALDNFSMALTAVPEPASAGLLMAMCALGGALSRRRPRGDRRPRD